MGIEDRAGNKIDDLAGKAKEAAGSVTGDEQLENEGKLDQAKARIAEVGEDIKDGVRDVAKKLGKND